jgi:hypothetical protein
VGPADQAAPGFQLPASRFRLPASGFRLPASGSRLPASGFPLPAAGFRLSAFTAVLRTRWTLEEPARLRALAAVPLAVALLAALATVLAEPPHDRILKSDVLYARGSETELVKEVGPPTRITTLPSTDMSHVASLCFDAARVLEYDIPSEGYPGRGRRTLRMDPFRIVMVCVNRSGVITGHSVVDIN